MNRGLAGEVVRMALDTLRGNKLRSGLTILGVVIGITAIVGMTSLIRGFDQSLRDSISQLGPNTIIVQKWGALSFSAGKSFLELARRPNTVVTSEELLHDIWGVDPRPAHRRRLRVAVSSLRRLLGQGAQRPRIETVVRVGYRLATAAPTVLVS